jgi:hypothetical protein
MHSHEPAFIAGRELVRPPFCADVTLLPAVSRRLRLSVLLFSFRDAVSLLSSLHWLSPRAEKSIFSLPSIYSRRYFLASFFSQFTKIDMFTPDVF